MTTSVNDRLIIALDVPTAGEALELFARLRDVTRRFKVGSQLFTAAGPELVRELVQAGAQVFLDLKFHDIPNTVAAASIEAMRLGVWMLNVHALGGGEMMRRTCETLSQVCQREGLARPKIIAVTVLTSADAATLAGVGIKHEPLEEATRLSRLAADCGLDGIVASPHEICAVRLAVEREGFLIVTPGVRPQGAADDDQKRVMTPALALRAGADYLVVGRAILRAADPALAAREICEEMQRAAVA
ncbi:MAG TPA: orotidine-5'-phosphate decarboxylase [Pyrinomonadaceae bacterium]|jgi:orotidine-5'-phosphate decarboxylase